MKNNPAIIFLFPDEKGNFLYHLGSAYIIGYLRARGIPAEQFVSRRLAGVRELTSSILRKGPRFIGFTCFNSNYFLVRLLCEYIKKEDPGVVTMLGGPTATFSAAETLRDCRAIDLCIRGEGEQTVSEIVQARRQDWEGIRGISSRKGSKIFRSPERPFMPEIDAAPSPYLNAVIHPSEMLRINNEVSILTSRGCVFKCTYCNFSAMSRYTVRYHSVGRVMAELRFISDSLARDGLEDSKILIQDDTFTLDRKRAQEICREIVREKIRLRFWLLTRADKVDRGLLRLLFKAGFRDINFGLESAVPRILYNVKKARFDHGPRRGYRPERLFINKTKEQVGLAKKLGFRVGASVIFGLPGERRNDALKTINFVKSLHLETYAHNYLSIFKGTELSRTYVGYGLVLRKPKFKGMLFNDQTVAPPHYPYDVRQIPILDHEMQVHANMPYALSTVYDALTGYYGPAGGNSLRDIVVLGRSFPFRWNIASGALQTRFIYGRGLERLVSRRPGQVELTAGTLSGFSPQYRMPPEKLQDLVPAYLKAKYVFAGFGGDRSLPQDGRLVRIAEEKDLEDFLLHRQPRNYILLDSCRWAGRCPAACARLLVKGASVISCFRGGRIGTIDESLDRIRKRLDLLRSKEEKKRGCRHCPVRDNCSRCIFPGMDSRQYCRLRREYPGMAETVRRHRLVYKLLINARN